MSSWKPLWLMWNSTSQLPVNVFTTAIRFHILDSSYALQRTTRKRALSSDHCLYMCSMYSLVRTAIRVA